jgi:hypothetical protein
MLISIVSLVFGSIGLGYAISTLIRRRIEMYSIAKGAIVEYTGRPAQVVSVGLLLASLALLAIAIIGFQVWGLLLIAAICYYGSLNIANRMIS